MKRIVGIILLFLITGVAVFFWASEKEKLPSDSVSKENDQPSVEEVENEEEVHWTEMEPKQTPSEPSKGRAELVANATTGEILYGDNIDEELAIASITKMITQYMVLDRIDRGVLTWDTTYRISENFLEGYDRNVIATIGLQPHKDYTVRYLFEAVSVVSANDAAVALGELMGGTESAYTQMMNDMAHELGMTSTKYINATGLPQNGEHNYSTARDLLRLGSAMVERYPNILKFSSMSSLVSEYGETHVSTNWLLQGMPLALEGVDGLKTGFTEKAGPSFVATGTSNGERYFVVLLNYPPNGNDMKTPKFQRASDLIQQFFPKKEEVQE